MIEYFFKKNVQCRYVDTI